MAISRWALELASLTAFMIEFSRRDLFSSSDSSIISTELISCLPLIWSFSPFDSMSIVIAFIFFCISRAWLSIFSLSSILRITNLLRILRIT